MCHGIYHENLESELATEQRRTVNIDQKQLLKTLNEAIKYKGTPGTARDGQN